MRLRAIWCCLWFGILPWQLYQGESHYRRGYARHLYLNLATVLHWALWIEPAERHDFEREVNPSWRCVWDNMFRPCR